MNGEQELGLELRRGEFEEDRQTVTSGKLIQNL